MSLQEVNEVAAVIASICADDANIIFGTSVDETYKVSRMYMCMRMCMCTCICA